MPEGALSDIRVIDLSQGIAGPYCTKLLADYGAEVIKVEPPGEGDPARRLGPFPDDLPHPERSGLFLYLNTNKKSITLDVSTTSGVVILKKLLARADVLVESYPVGQMAQWGLGHDNLKGDFPNLVHVSITPFGHTGPYRKYRANSLVAMAMSAVMYATGDPDKEPLTTGGTPADYLAGEQCWLGVLAALIHRDREGQGQHVDVSLAEAAASIDEYNAAMYAFGGAIRRRYYSRHVYGYPMDILPCKDGYVVVIPGATGFPSLATIGTNSPMALLLENLELDQHPLFWSMGDRMVRWQEVDEILRPYLESHAAKEIVETAQALRMPFAYVPTVADLLADEHLKTRSFFVEAEHPEAGNLAYPGPPFRMSATPFRVGRAPLLGEHNEETLVGELGYEKEDLTILRDRDVI